MKIREVLSNAKESLQEIGRSDRAAFEILKSNLKMEAYEMYDKLEEEIMPNVLEEYQRQLDYYLSGIPLQHILGYETFFGRDLIVNSKVLIPRYETEELVENILYHIDDFFEDYEQISVADIGCGSGAIAITLDLEEYRTKVYASDVSEDALEVAKDNNKKFEANVNFYQGDLLQPLIDQDIKVDILVSNPPYIPDEEFVDATVKDHEPNVALFGGEDGLNFYRRIFEDAHKIINDKALLAFEIGHNQKDIIVKEVEKHFSEDSYEILKDMNGKNRMLFIYHNLK